MLADLLSRVDPPSAAWTAACLAAAVFLMWHVGWRKPSHDEPDKTERPFDINKFRIDPNRDDDEEVNR